jgi:hypothetical protein
LVERLVQRGTHDGETRPHTTRLSITSNCIPEFAPGRPNQSSARWLDKIDQMARANLWDENTVIQLMPQRLSGLARKWYDNLTVYTYMWEEWKTLLMQTFPDHRNYETPL